MSSNSGEIKDNRSEYWKNLGITEKGHGRIFTTNSKYFNERGIYAMCDECCNGDRCDDPSHRRRQNCPYCLGTGTNLTAEEHNATSNSPQSSNNIKQEGV